MRRSILVGLMAFLTVLVLSPLSVLATTWRVEQDESVDFEVLQYALDATVDGDTLLIGPAA